MPRPGPRPYECGKRAWHSDRHQPIRGSLIQEIFRVVNEIHSSQTKKNKEWQEKLPVVVLKAEEIMYSKANSEAEYMDLQTLWERSNDAINTIIRREEGTESGDLLQPCIEAALILGCTARRASRSQRNINPRSYLTPSPQEPTPDSVTHGGSSHSGNPTSTPPYYSTQDHNPSISRIFPSSSQSLPPSPSNQIHSWENLGHSFPLYYGAHHQTRDPQVVLGGSEPQPNEKSFLQNFFTIEGVINGSRRNTKAYLRSTMEDPSEIACDLSLHLAPLCASTDSRCTHQVEDIVSSSSQEGSKSRDRSPRRTTRKEFCFFPRENADQGLESSSSKGKGVEDLDGSNRKQKASVSNLVEAQQFSYASNISPHLSFGRMKQPHK